LTALSEALVDRSPACFPRLALLCFSRSISIFTDWVKRGRTISSVTLAATALSDAFPAFPLFFVLRIQRFSCLT
jgi:hypothetical protein